ncbi:hypothetical protein GLN27_23480 [Shigella flexneri]|nr:hypothetical protein [Shigella flexneri]
MSINNYGLHTANNKNMHLIIGSNTANENKGMKNNIINVTNTAISHAINKFFLFRILTYRRYILSLRFNNRVRLPFCASAFTQK